MSKSMPDLKNLQQSARKRLSDMVEYSNIVDRPVDQEAVRRSPSSQLPKHPVSNNPSGNLTRQSPKTPARRPSCEHNSLKGSFEEGPQLPELMQEKESIVQKLKEIVGMTKNEDKGDWNPNDCLADIENDPTIGRGCMGESSCSYHCKLCDVHLSGLQPLSAHKKSKKHLKNASVNVEPRAKGACIRGEISDPADVVWGPCSTLACTKHCSICDKCMTGPTPAMQHLESDKHKKKEAMKGILVSPPTNQARKPSSDSSFSISPVSGNQKDIACGKVDCKSHCYFCERCFKDSEECNDHSHEHQRLPKKEGSIEDNLKGMNGMNSNSVTSFLSALGPQTKSDNFKSLGTEGSESTFSRMNSIEPSTIGSTSLSWDGYMEAHIDTSDFIEKNVCLSIGCSYHCFCCNTHLSGLEPMHQHKMSSKHLNMAKVYSCGKMGSKVNAGSPEGIQLHELDLQLSGLTLGDQGELGVEEISGSCGKIGCVFHCMLCSTCLSGNVPKTQHIASKNHCHVRERLGRVAKVSAAGSSGQGTKQDATNTAQPTCEHPGCSFHCFVCDKHLSGQEPKEQHLVSKNHLKQKQIFEGTRVINPGVYSAKDLSPSCHAAMDLPTVPGVSPFGPSQQGPKPIGYERALKFQAMEALHKDGLQDRNQNQDPVLINTGQQPEIFVPCPNTQPGCSYHCLACNLHLNDVGPKHQHESSAKHQMKLQQLQLGRLITGQAPGTSPTSSRSISPNSPATTTASQLPTDDDAFGPCPESSRICMVHCFACDKHFNEKRPKIQHETSAKHLKNVPRYFAGLKTKETDPKVSDDAFIIQSMGNADHVLKTQLKTSKSSSKSNLPNWVKDHCHSQKIQRLPAGDYTPRTRNVPRDYQMELYHKAMRDDTICFLPTGTGKTFVSALVIDHMLEMNPTRPVLFLVDRILLVLQQTRYLRNELGSNVYERSDPKTKTMEKRPLNIAGLCSGHADAGGKTLQELDIIVTTAGYFMNILSKEWLKWEDFCLVVIDEVHHCIKKHVYNNLMVEYHLPLEQESRPKLFGLTASPAGEPNVPLTQEMLTRLLGNIGTAKLIVVEDHQKQLSEFQTRTDLEIDLAEMSEEENELEDDIQSYLLHIFNFLVKTTNLGALCKELGLNIQSGARAMSNPMAFVDEGLEAFRSSLKMLEVKDKGKSMGAFIRKIIEHCDQVCDALLGLRLCGEEAVFHSLCPLSDARNSCGFQAMSALGFCCDNLQTRAINFESLTKDRMTRMTAFGRLLNRIIDGIDWSAESQDAKPIVMVIVRERKVAKLLATLLKENDHILGLGLNVEFLCGHGDGEVGMTVTQQRRLLEETWQHHYQVLVATSVAEEGLDLPECKLVIEMDPPGNVTSLVQIRGRARKQCSRLVALCRSEDQVEKIRRLETREECMIEAAKAVVNQQKRSARNGVGSSSMSSVKFY